jgi:hypothetical protein
MDFARANPALYEAMFTLTVDLAFPEFDSQSPQLAAFVEFRDALAPLAGDRDLDTFTEILECTSWPGDPLPGRPAAP